MKLRPPMISPSAAGGYAAAEMLFAPSPEAARLASRFDHFQHYVLNHVVEHMPPQQTLVGCLLALESIPDLGVLKQVLARSSEWRDEAVSWRQQGVLHRRVLSNFTVQCWRRLTDHQFNWEIEINAFISSYQEFARIKGSVPEVIASLLRCSGGWHDVHLPPLMAAHLRGMLPLAAISELAWSRQFRRPTTAVQLDDTEELQDTFVDLLAPHTIETKEISGQWFVGRLKATFDGCTGEGVNLSNQRARAKLISNLRQLKGDMKLIGIPELLIYGWLLDMLRHGSANRRKPAIRTLYLYIHAAARRIHDGIKSIEEDPLEFDAATWKSVYETALALSPGDSSLRPALLCFHRFLVRFLDVDPLEGYLQKAEDRAPVANLIWPHEFHAVKAAILDAKVPERVAAQTMIMALLLENTSLRKREIDGLRLCSINRGKTRVWVTVAPRKSHKSLKTPAARRTVAILDESAGATLLAWVERRRTESASKNDLLFEDPHLQGRLYAPAACYRLLLTALKTATGDSAVGIHTCRHTFASRLIAEGLTPNVFAPISRINVVQQLMGHASAETTLQTYFHSYERNLRDWIDQYTWPRVSSRSLEKWTGHTASAIRKRKSRAGADNWLEMTKLFKDPPVQELPVAEQPTVAVAERGTGVAGPLRISQILKDLQAGMTSEAVTLRNSCTTNFLVKISTALVPGKQVKESIDLAGRVQEASESLKGFDFSRLHNKTWSNFLQLAGGLGSEVSALLVANWRAQGSKYGVAMNNPLPAELLQLMRRAGFAPGRLVLRVARWGREDLDADADAQKQLEQVRVALAEAFGSEVQREEVRPRRGRPSRYLVPLTRACHSSRPPACVDAKSLAAAMACVCIAFDLEDINIAH